MKPPSEGVVGKGSGDEEAGILGHVLPLNPPH